MSEARLRWAYKAFTGSCKLKQLRLQAWLGPEYQERSLGSSLFFYPFLGSAKSLVATH